MESLFPKDKLHIGIDVDGVLRDFCKGLLDVIKSEYPSYIKKDTEPLRHWDIEKNFNATKKQFCLLYTSPSPRDKRQSRMPSSA